MGIEHPHVQLEVTTDSTPSPLLHSVLDPLALSTPTRANSAFSPSSLRLQPALALIAWLQSVGVLQNQGDSLHALLSAAERVGFEFDETSGEDVYLRGVVCFFRFRKPE